MDNTHRIDKLRISTFVLGIIGAIFSLVMVIKGGQNNKSILLILLFIGWVLSPFITLIVTNRISERWPVLFRTILYSLTVIVTLGSFVAYGGILHPQGTKPAFVFLVVPLLWWLLIGIFFLMLFLSSRKGSQRGFQ
jgi:hypothetical protein